jgi:TolB-like protein
LKKDDTSGPEENGLLARLLERHVVQAAALYVAVAWGAVEILLTLQERLGWPEWLATTALALFVAGFPLVLVWSWYRDLESPAARALVVVGAAAVAGIAFWLTLGSEPQREFHPAPNFEAVATVAVLKFENLTGSESEDYLAEGFTGDVIARLSKHPDLAVIQMESLGSPVLASLIPTAQASALDADYHVTGSVRREDKFIEIDVRLNDLDGNVLWTERFREPYSAESIATIQRRVSGEISRQVGTQVGAPEFCGETTDLNAMELYYQGRRRVMQRRADNIEAGIETLKQSVELDPYFGRAWNVLAEAYLALPGWMMDPKEAEQAQATMHPLGIAAARRAYDLCPTMGWAYKITVPAYEGVPNQWIEQEMEWRDALAMDPNDGGLLRQYSRTLQSAGRASAALEAARRAYENDPLMAGVVQEYAWAHIMTGDCEQAVRIGDRVEELGGSKMRWARLNCAPDGDSLLEVLRYQDELTGGMMLGQIGIAGREEAWVDALFDPESPHIPEVRAALREMWLSNPTGENPMLTWIVGNTIRVRDYDSAFEILDTVAWDFGFRGIMLGRGIIWGNAPGKSEFRADPRFAALMDHVGLREYWETYGWADKCAPEGDGFRCF